MVASEDGFRVPVLKPLNDHEKHPPTLPFRRYHNVSRMPARILSLSGKLILAIALSFAVAASQPRRSFETISIKASAPGSRSPSISGLERFSVKNASLRVLIRVAYQSRECQISGDPNWIDSAHYD